ncbi:MAG: ABC transporter permease [Deltaproteobacteria bacterium]|nr:MAG: ABC transporter permease [Deltaproteobacteria bacterium]
MTPSTLRHAAREALRLTGAVVLLEVAALRARRLGGWPRGELWRQLEAAGNRSFPLVALTIAFVGMVLTVQAGYQLERILGDTRVMGPAYLKLMLRDFAPVLTALMVAARYGAGIAAELGTMTVTEEVDALRMNAAHPAAYLVAPRILACAAMTPVLSLLAVAIAAASGALTAWQFFAIPWRAFVDLSLTQVGDLVAGLTKALAFGLYVAGVAALVGLEAEGGSVGVGRATNRAVVLGSLGVILLDVVLGILFFALGQ